jgi:uncharacterized membrane protein
MRTDILASHLNLNKLEVTLIASVVGLIALMGVAMNINFIADYFGIKIAADWYRELTDWIAAGGSLAGFAAIVMGVTLPAWMAGALAAFGAYAA